jgi:hypothetical protein
MIANSGLAEGEELKSNVLSQNFARFRNPSNERRHKGQTSVISGTANAITITESGKPNFQ